MTTQPTETPRTDKATWTADSINQVDGVPVVDASFARTLERELAVMTAERDRLRDVKWEGIHQLETTIATLTAQLEEARRALDATKQALILLPLDHTKECSETPLKCTCAVGKKWLAIDAPGRTLAALTERKEKV
jgi:predicted kinase